MTGQIVSPRCRAAVMSSTSAWMRRSTTAKTSSTVRPEAAIRARSAALIARVAAARSSGVCSQCGSVGGGTVAGRAGDDTATPSRKGGLLETTLSVPPFLGKTPVYNYASGTCQAFAGAPAVTDRRARAARPHAAPAADARGTIRRDRDL